MHAHQHCSQKIACFDTSINVVMGNIAHHYITKRIIVLCVYYKAPRHMLDQRTDPM